MRDRKTILEENQDNRYFMIENILEVLLDIRDLLTKKREEIKHDENLSDV